MDVRKINVEDSIFPLPTEYNNKTEYASIAQAAERILGKDNSPFQLVSRNFTQSRKALISALFGLGKCDM